MCYGQREYSNGEKNRLASIFVCILLCTTIYYEYCHFVWNFSFIWRSLVILFQQDILLKGDAPDVIWSFFPNGFPSLATFTWTSALFMRSAITSVDKFLFSSGLFDCITIQKKIQRLNVRILWPFSFRPHRNFYLLLRRCLTKRCLTKIEVIGKKGHTTIL